ncbi:hypothetical protein C5167_036905 [Papaver somniferum]|uniref:Uncharacterized protein n=1 Tax=Papaver somniferum TaxID=3469 RepID=A0A4Y7I994_PAPSO|nr:hypothetical protein C5167_036905 [Papaver somniferum]
MEDPSSIATHPEAVIRKYDGGAPTAADERSKEESTISSSSISSDPSSSFSSSSEEEEKEKEVKEKEEKEKEKEESKETITEDVPPPTETEEQTTEDVEGPLLLSGSRALRRPQRPPVGTGRPPQHN